MCLRGVMPGRRKPERPEPQITMDTPKVPIAADDALFEVERRIARRADELVRLSVSDQHQALKHWLEAEREVWQDVELHSLPAR